MLYPEWNTYLENKSSPSRIIHSVTELQWRLSGGAANQRRAVGRAGVSRHPLRAGHCGRATSRLRTGSRSGESGCGMAQNIPSAGMEACRAAIFLLALAVSTVSGIEIYTKSKMIVENGTDVRLSCTFKSKEIIRDSILIDWTFKPETDGTNLKIFTYLFGNAFPAPGTRFQDRVIWDGNVNRNDASIIITNMNFKDNGTYGCSVSIAPDIAWFPSDIHLSVVEQGSSSKHAGIIAGLVIAAIVGLMLIIGIVYFFKKKKQGQRNGYIGIDDYSHAVEEMGEDSLKSMKCSIRGDRMLRRRKRYSQRIYRDKQSYLDLSDNT
uniref:myelin protein zero-like protein 2 isoform X3 n=1 Tax=Pristiophorus japonicus TaxID=55135 RepID=UPI00398F1A5E